MEWLNIISKWLSRKLQAHAPNENMENKQKLTKIT